MASEKFCFVVNLKYIKRIAMREDDLKNTNDRLVFFSDAVIAISITLLGLRLTVPLGDNKDLIHALYEMWPRFEFYLISFVMIGLYWHLHHRLFKIIIKHDTTLILLNFLWLICVTILPFSTDLLGRYNLSHTATVIYMLNLIAIGVAKLSIWLYATHNHRLISKRLSAKSIRYGTIRALIPIFVFASAIAVSFIHVVISKYALILVFIIPPFVHNLLFKKEAEI